MGTISKASGSSTSQFDAAVERWAVQLPPDVRDSFRAEFYEFGIQYETALDTVQSIWERRELAYTFDEFTGLATRGAFYDYLAALLNETRSPGLAAVGVLFIDVDHLKRINDTCGHRVGDQAIAAVGTIVREALRVERRVDSIVRVTDDTYSVGRHGGDEFVAALALADPSDIELVAPRVKQRADDPDRQRARGYTAPVPLTISVGGVVYELPVTAPCVASNALGTALLTAADALMYESKRDGFIHLARARFTDKLEVHGARELSPTA